MLVKDVKMDHAHKKPSDNSSLFHCTSPWEEKLESLLEDKQCSCQSWDSSAELLWIFLSWEWQIV